jgi:hypothetical protein
MVLMRGLTVIAAVMACAACSGGPTRTGEVPFHGSSATVLVFFSPHCHCFLAHEERLRELYARYHERGVAFYLVDSEVGASGRKDELETLARGIAYSPWMDAGAKLAEQVGAEYATFTVVADARGRVRYRGGIDSDRDNLHDDATPYVADALDDVLAGREPRLTEAKALGCTLQKW